MALRLLQAAPVALCYLEGPDLVVRAANAAALEALGTPNLPSDSSGPAQPVHGFDSSARSVLDRVLVSGREDRFMQRRADSGTEDLRVYEFLARPDLGPDGSVRGIFLSGRALAVPGVTGAGPLSDPPPASRDDEVSALQRELLPEAMPIVPNVHVTAHCLKASAEAMGGDWFDAVSPPGGGLALVVGEVPGHGIAAAAVMGQLRAVAAHAMASGATPEATIDQLDSYAGRVPRARGSTALVAAIDPASGTVRVAQRGHLPPLLLRAGGAHRFADVAPSSPLGLPGQTTSCVASLSDDEIVVLYTDGLVSGAGVSIDAGMARLGAAASATVAEGGVPPRLDALAGTLVQQASVRDRPPDDATIVVARFSPVQPPVLELRADTTHDSLSETRAQLASWLEALGAGEDDIFALQHAVTEAAVAVAEHAVRHPAQVDIHARLGRAGTATVRVSEDSEWTGDPAADGGRSPLYDRTRGLILMLELVDDLQVETVAAGTVMTLRRRLGRPTRLGTAPTTPGRRGPGSELDAFLRTEGDGRVLMVLGALGTEAVEDFRLAVVAAARRGAVLGIDLSGVTVMGGAAVTLLHSLVSGGGVALRAVPGSPAHAVMTLTALPFSADGGLG